MLKKLLFFIFIFIAYQGRADNEGISQNPNESLEVLTKLRYVGVILEQCSRADYIRSNYCKPYGHHFLEIPTKSSCVSETVELVKNFPFDSSPYTSELFNSFIENSYPRHVERFESAYQFALKNWSGDINNACKESADSIHYSIETYKRYISNYENVDYLTTDESKIILGDTYYEINFKTDEGIDEALEFYKEASKNKKFNDLKLLAFIGLKGNYFLPIELQLKILEFNYELTPHKKHKNYIYKDIQNLKNRLNTNGQIQTQFLSSLNTSWSQDDLNDLDKLFDITKNILIEFIKFRKETLTQFEIQSVIDKFKNTPVPPLNRLNKIKEKINEKFSYETVILLNDIGFKIHMPINIIRNWYEYAKTLDLEKKYLNNIDHNLNNFSILEDYGGVTAPMNWVKNNDKYLKKYFSDYKYIPYESLKKITIDYINDYQKNISFVLAEDYMLESYKNAFGEYTKGNYINEYAAQDLAEQALKVSKIELGSQTVEDQARFVLGHLFMHSFNPKIKNSDLGKLHLEQILFDWIQECKNYNLIDNFPASTMLIECSKINSFWRKIDSATISNVLKIIYEEDSTFDYSEYIDQLYTLYKILDSQHIDHVTLYLKKPKLFNSYDDYINYLDEEYMKTSDERILEIKYDFMLDRNDYFSIDQILNYLAQCKEIMMGTNNQENSSSILMGDIENNQRYLNKIKNNMFIVKDDFDIDSYFSNKKTPTKEERKLENKFKKLNKDGEKRYALVIGNSDYIKTPLTSPLNDANTIEKVLKELNFEVTKLTNLDTKSFNDALIEFGLKTKNADLSLFYYSGHAYELGGLNYLLPVNINLDGERNKLVTDSIDLNKLIKKNISGKTKLVFLDSCRNNALNKNGLIALNLTNNTLVSFAAGFNQFALDGQKDLSPYTESLAKNIKEKDSINNILINVRKEVKEQTQNKQIPEDFNNLTDRIVLNAN